MASSIQCLKIFVLLLFLFLVCSKCDKKTDNESSKTNNKRQAKCSIKHREIRVKPNLSSTPVEDICWFCQNTPCGKQASVIELLEASDSSRCNAAKLKDCCPNVQLIKMDNKALCDCFCEKNFYVRGSGKEGFAQCGASCPAYPPGEASLNSVTGVVSDPAVVVQELKKDLKETSSSQFVMSITSLIIALVIAVPSIILVLFGLYCYCNKRKGITTMFNNVSNTSNRNVYTDNPANGRLAGENDRTLSLEAERLLQQQRQLPIRQMDECTEASSTLLQLGDDHQSFKPRHVTSHDHNSPNSEQQQQQQQQVTTLLLKERQSNNGDAPSERLMTFSDSGAGSVVGGARDRELQTLIDKSAAVV